ncbi:hypothetical protein [Variovorax sp. EL159]|uniref:hypothetical protein n=1 Tax=Variovorax sp. EL159 TaxID=1566270 RepID=UPI00115F8081|nr:hypothetical protein [Variovorax sp. EL159]
MLKRLNVLLASRIVWACETEPEIPRVAKWIPHLRPARRRNVHRLATLQIDHGMDEVDIETTIWASVFDGRPAIPMRTEPGECNALEVVEQLLNFLIAQFLFWRETQRPRLVAPLEIERSRNVCDHLRIAAQNANSSAWYAFGIQRRQDVVDGVLRTALAMRSKGKIHAGSFQMRLEDFLHR